MLAHLFLNYMLDPRTRDRELRVASATSRPQKLDSIPRRSSPTSYVPENLADTIMREEDFENGL